MPATCGFVSPRSETHHKGAGQSMSVVSEGGLEHANAGNFPDSGKSYSQDSGAIPVRVKLVLPRCDMRGRVIYFANGMLSHMAGHCHAGHSAVLAWCQRSCPRCSLAGKGMCLS